MNTVVIVNSLKYVSSNYKVIVGLSTWINLDNNYSNSKFTKSLNKKDIEVSELLIKYASPEVLDKELDFFAVRLLKDGISNNSQDVDEHNFRQIIMEFAEKIQLYKYKEIIYLLLDHGAYPYDYFFVKSEPITPQI